MLERPQAEVKILVVANCQCLPISQMVAIGTNNTQVHFIDVGFVQHEPHKSRITQMLNKEYDIVFSIPLSERWADLNMAALNSQYGEKARTFTNIHFDGLHPDITYVGEMGARVRGLMSDYHSKLILFSYATHRNVDDCIALFNAKTYEKVGYFSQFAISARELVERDKNCDVKFAAEFLELIKISPSLYTINHPADTVFRSLCTRLCSSVDQNFISYPAEYFVNSLATNVVWPIYNEIAEHLSLQYRTPQHFITSASDRGRSMTLESVIKRFFQIYEQSGSSDFAEHIRKMPFFSHLYSTLA